MKTVLETGLCLALFGFTALSPLAAQETEQPFYGSWVDYRDGRISVAFNQTPVDVAASAIRARTGFEIVLPPAGETRLVNLHLTRTRLEPAVRSLISSAGFQNYAVIYDQHGRPGRAVVLGRAPQNPAPQQSEASVAEQGGEPLGPEEAKKLALEMERWPELKQEERGRIEDRLKSLPPSPEREKLVQQYARQVLGIKD
ncbi:MAG TPA: hypothetical protein VNN77_02200 [candidate division Zixibacteria bacterium]|nr:hypothetical protein [candidate division Zixibacteria bacterium]